MKLLAFGASNSRHSINRQFAGFAASQIEGAEVNLLDLNAYEMPIYSPDRQKENGIHPLALKFKEQVEEADGIVISFAEYNGSFTAAFKNIYDWVSRIDRKVWMDKPLFLLSTAPGGRGGRSVLEHALLRYHRTHGGPIFDFTLPSFHQNFDAEKGITEPKLKEVFETKIEQFEKALSPVGIQG